MTGQIIEPGSDEWLHLMTASKVGAVLGVSPWESPRSTWHRMHGDLPNERQTEEQSRGHYLEPAVLAWFFDKHPEFVRGPSETFIHPANPRYAATPDATAYDPMSDVFVVVEGKTDAGDGEFWGDPGTDQIPVYYAAQCVWQAYVTGAERVYVPALVGRMDFREYVVEAQPELAEEIAAKCAAFLASLDAHIPPELDGHTATYEAVLKLHPLIEKGSEVEISREHAAQFVEAYTAAKAWDQRLTFAKATLATAMGTAQYAKYGGKTVARRQATSGPKPAIYAATPLPTIEEVAA